MTEANPDTPVESETPTTTEPDTPPKSPAELLADAKAEGVALDITDDDFLAATTDFVAAIKSAVRTETAALNAKKRAAFRDMSIRLHIMWKGRPDWSGESPAYSDVVVPLRDEAYRNVRRDIRQKTDAAIRQLVNRTFRELIIAYYVLRNASADLTGGEIPEMPKPEDVIRLETVPAISIVRGNETLRAAMRAEYLSAGLNVPAEYGGASPERGETGGPEPGEPENPLAAIGAAFQSAREVGTFLARAEGVHRYMSELSADLLAKTVGSIADRPAVIETLERSAVVLNETLRLITGHADDPDAARAAIDAAAYRPEQ